MKKLTVIMMLILTSQLGRISFLDHTETYYNLKMNRICSKAIERQIPGFYWERPDGCKMWGDKIIVAADFNLHPYGSTVLTSLGEGIVLDTGSFKDRTTIDIATTW